jgi:hypothetical protein
MRTASARRPASVIVNRTTVTDSPPVRIRGDDGRGEGNEARMTDAGFQPPFLGKCCRGDTDEHPSLEYKINHGISKG